MDDHEEELVLPRDRSLEMLDVAVGGAQLALQLLEPVSVLARPRSFSPVAEHQVYDAKECPDRASPRSPVSRSISRTR
ncbi:MAG: hypothetical protein IT305_03930 [Chloroflexi bacterium]|nr:hypothetical protein [Chloroflexota bacterium]